jgi:transposase
MPKADGARRGPGRPTKLNDEVQLDIVRAIELGANLEDAAGYVGVDPTTIHNWLKRGREARTGVFREFHDAVKRALAEQKVNSIQVITRASAKHWKAAAWLLARRYPEEYGSKQTITVQVQRGVEQILESVREHMTSDAYGELIRAIAVVSGMDPQAATH